MLDASQFISATIHEREVELADGKTHKLYFKELPYIEFSRYQAGVRSADEEERATASIKLIVASLCEPDGEPAITHEQAAKLKPAVAVAIFKAASDVSTPAKKKPLKETPTSGTS